MQPDTPVLLIAFNRPDKTRRILAAIRIARPKRLFIAVDGPRESNAGDASANKELRNMAMTEIDWPCKVETLFREKNLGCGHGPSSAISWFFEHVGSGIILEDDCLPDSSFFPYAAELLERYANNEKIMHIGGYNHPEVRPSAYSYYFSHYVLSWGWATWKRAWRRYDAMLIPESERRHVWDGAWELSIRKAGGLAILPERNLVENIGFGADATHTTDESYIRSAPGQIAFPLRHPGRTLWNPLSDYYTFRNHYRRTLSGFILRRLGLRPRT